MSSVEVEFAGGAGGRWGSGAIANSGLIDLGDRIARLVGRVSRGIADSLLASGKVTSPGVGVAIATLAAPPAGKYEISVAFCINAAGTSTGNMELRAGATPILSGIGGGTPPTMLPPLLRTLDGVTALSVNATVSDASGAIYEAQIIATRIE